MTSRALLHLASCLALASCAPSAAPTTIGAPSRITSALDLFGDLGAAAQLVPRDGDPGAPVELSRGEDGVSFSGFLDAAPGEYTLEIAFTGVREGTDARVFLGRWTSDAFTVVQGEAARPAFTAEVDTIGRPEDHGDDDEDGLGLLDEALLGTDAASPDSDDDGVQDGDDCDPVDGARALAIAEGGDVRDCDGDGFERLDPPYGAPGEDCDDRAADVNPAAEDVCTDAVDADCNGATCPVDDGEGPVVADVATSTGGVVGCQARIRARATDPSGVTSVFATMPDDPYRSFERVGAMTDPDEDDVWEAELSTMAYGALANGPHRLVVKAIDAKGNTSSVETTIDVEFVAPSVEMTGAARLEDAPITVTVTPSSTRPIASVKLMTAELRGGADGGLQATWTLVKDLGPAGGTTTIAPSDVPGTHEALIFPVVEDDVGNVIGPGTGSVPDASGRIYASYPCDAATLRYVPTILRAAEAAPGQRTKMKELLAEAETRARAVLATAELVQINGFEVQEDGAIDLSSTTVYTRWWVFYFKEPGAQRWISVRWDSAAYGATNPEVNVDDGSVSAETPIVDADQLLDSDAAVAAYHAADPLCDPITASSPGSIIYAQDADGPYVMVFSETSEGWKGHGTTGAQVFETCE